MQKPEAVFKEKSKKLINQYQNSLINNFPKLKETPNIRSGAACQEVHGVKVEKEHLWQSWQY